jgi:signal transduction histidine kinase
MIRIRLFIYGALLSLALLSGAASLWAGLGMMEVFMGLSPHKDYVNQLERSLDQLKELAALDPKREAEYKEEFVRLQQRMVIQRTLNSELESVRRASLSAFLLIVGAGLLLGLVFGWALNQFVVRAHQRSLEANSSTLRKLASLQQQEGWRQLAQKIAHEVRNPLTPVKALVGRLLPSFEKEGATERFHRDLAETQSIVLEEVERIDRWLTAFVNFAQLPKPHFEIVNLGSELETFRKKAENLWPQLKIVLEREGNERALVSADSSLLQQVFFNLAKNSAEATGEANLRMILKADEKEIHLDFWDNGPGIHTDQASKLFLPLVSAKAGSGRGLGLAICRSILEAQGATIRHEPKSEGTRFTIHWSLEESGAHES